LQVRADTPGIKSAESEFMNAMNNRMAATARWLRSGLVMAALVLMLTAASQALGGEAATGPDHKVRIVLVGDSTVTEKAGWGLGFTQFLKGDIECVNTAMGGRSSRSFRDEGRWTNALALKGDYYLIQFGHNNEPGKPGRSTDMPTFIQDMKNYVDEARAIGARPVLITPLTRRQWDPSTDGKIKSSLAPYADEVKKIGAGKHVPVLDLHARSIELCEQLGREECLKFSPMKKGTNTVDGTHLNADGSVMFGRLVVEELRKAVPELATKFRAEPVKSTVAPRDAAGEATLQAALPGVGSDGASGAR
jgi:pectinesterase